MVRKHQTRNLEISGSMLTHRPEMTFKQACCRAETAFRQGFRFLARDAAICSI
jgi:hypothetical protein